jgi:hypothetical protein
VIIPCKSCDGAVQVPDRPPFTTMIETQCPHCRALVYVVPLQQGKAMLTGRRLFPGLPPIP